MATPQLAILDTDIGDDIDDAFALGLALRSPELRLLGITTAYGDTELRARLLDRYLAAVGQADIPVAAGVATAHSNVFTQAAYARQTPDSEQAKKHPDAVEFLLSQIRAHPGQITLIAIGPLFNIQATIERDPATFRQLKRVVMMAAASTGATTGGTGSGGQPTLNGTSTAIRRGEGAAGCWSSGLHDAAGLDADPSRSQGPGSDFSHGSPLTDQLTLLYHQWMAGSEGHPITPTLFDPVAVAYAIHPELCPATPMRVEVDDKGFTLPVQGIPNAQVCLKSDESGFLELLLDRIAKDGSR